MDGYLSLAIVYLGAALVAVPVAARLGLGSVLGYLLAGVAVGPLLGLVGAEMEALRHFAEIGVVMMLFLVGLELQPRALWAMRGQLLGLGGLQVALTTLAVMAAGMALGLPWSVALAVGFVLCLSSTAIVLQTLAEKGLMRAQGGQASFAVLLAQDIAVIPMLALIPLLALPEFVPAAHDAGQVAGHAASLVEGLPGWQVALATVGAVGLVILGGTTLSRPLFRFIAGTKLREMFTVTALFVVIGIAFLMTLVGLSPALGAFLAGVVLATSEYRHELESDIEPFKGLLLGLFFITVGAGIDFGVLRADLVPVLALTVGLIALKALVMAGLATLFGLRGGDRWLVALGLAQAGEFAFVLLAFTVQNAAMGPALADRLLLVVALSMMLTPALFVLLDRVILPRAARGAPRVPDAVTEQGVAIIAGLGRFGQISNRVLLANGFRTVVLDVRAEFIDTMRKFGVRSFYGDAARPDLLAAAGLHTARLLVVAIDDPDRAVQIVQYARRENPRLHVIARAHDRPHVYRLYQAGADDIVRETFDSAVRAARYGLEALGIHPYEAEKITTTFVAEDRAALRELAALWDPDVPGHENPAYRERVKEINRRAEAAMQGNRDPLHDRSERAWMPPIQGAGDEEGFASRDVAGVGSPQTEER